MIRQNASKIAAPEIQITGSSCLKVTVCSVCGAVIVKQDVVPATGHSYFVTGHVDPSETANGYDEYTCSVCKDSYLDVIPMLVCPSAHFTDVKKGTWYHESVDFMVANGYMTGNSATLFGVNKTLNRGMLVTILYRIEGEPDVSGIVNPFTDVPEGKWYTNAVLWAYANGVVTGTSATTYKPLNAITREQIAAILYRYSGSPETGDDFINAFPDASTVSKYAKTPMNWAVANNYITGSKSNGVDYLVPKNNATRAQCATILARYLKDKADQEN